MGASYNLLDPEANQILLFIVSCAVIVCLLAIVFTTSYLAKIFSFSLLSTLICVIYLLLDAPDVAMTEASIGACLSTVILLIFATKSREGKNNSRQLFKKFFSLILCVLIGIIFIHFISLLPPVGEYSNPINHGPIKHYIEMTEQEINIPAFVAAILASYRGFDTLLETTVILIAGIAVFAILGVRDATR